VSFAVITPCVASQQVIPMVSVYFAIYSVRKVLDTPSYMVLCRHQNAGQDNLLFANKSSGHVAEFIYLGASLTCQNCIHGEIKKELNLGNASECVSSL
jgi:hypothetical protein